MDTSAHNGSQAARTPAHEPPAWYKPWMGRPKFGSLCSGARGGTPIPALAAGAGAGAGAPTPVQVRWVVRGWLQRRCGAVGVREVG